MRLNSSFFCQNVIEILVKSSQIWCLLRKKNSICLLLKIDVTDFFLEPEPVEPAEPAEPTTCVENRVTKTLTAGDLFKNKEKLENTHNWKISFDRVDDTNASYGIIHKNIDFAFEG